MDLVKDKPTHINYFGEPESDTSSIKSCLIINWEKKIYDGKKWSGTFTWTWSFENNGKGFVVVNIAKAVIPGQLNLTGGAYLLEKPNDQEWSVKYKKEVTTEKTFANSVFEDKFPKAKADYGVSVGSGSYWGFVTGNSDLDNICGGSSACPLTIQDTTKELAEFKWTQTQGESKKISDWSEIWKWWDEMYTENVFNLQASLEKFTGTWGKV